MGKAKTREQLRELSSEAREALADSGEKGEPEPDAMTAAKAIGPPRPDQPETGEGLESCPFCGSDDIDPAFMQDGDLLGTAPPEDCNMPGCRDCGATAPSAKAWNRRHSPPPQGNAEALANRLLRIHSALDDALGDMDIDWIESDEEERDQVPIQWAAKHLMGIVTELRDGGALAAHAEPSPDMEEALAALDEMWGMPADDDERWIYYETLHRFIHASRGVPEAVRRECRQIANLLADPENHNPQVRDGSIREAIDRLSAIAEADQGAAHKAGQEGE